MAHYQQSRHEARPNKTYRQRPPEDASQPYSPPSHNNFVVDQGFNFNESQQHESTQQYPEDGSGLYGVDPGQHGSRGQYGRGGLYEERGHGRHRVYDGWSGHNESRGREIYRVQDDMMAHHGQDMRIPPEQQRTIGPDRRANTGPMALGAARSNHVPSKNDSVAQKHAQYQDQDQNQPRKHRGTPREPAFEDEPAKISSSGHDRTEGYHGSGNYHPPPQRFPDRIDTNLTNLSKQVVLNNQQEDYREAYRQEISPGRGGFEPDYPSHDTVVSQFSNEHSKVVADNFQTSPLHKPPPRRNLTSPISPETRGWDNPFPTFPMNKGKAPPLDQARLTESVAGMSLNKDRRDRRPQTARSKSSQASSQPTERRHDVNDTINQSLPSSQMPPERQDFDRGWVQPQRPEYQPLGRSQTQPSEYGAGPMPQVEQRIDYGRRSEDTRVRPTFSSNGFDPQRSRTMPNKISEAVQDLDPQRGYVDQPDMQEPSPHPAYFRSESVKPFPSRPVGTSRPRATDRLGSQPDETNTTHNNGGLNSRELASRTQHSTQNSLGDFYDSYYNTAQNDQQPHVQSSKNQQPCSPDEDMPNFDAVPHSYTSYSQAMAIDDHLPPKQVTTHSPPSPQYQHANIESSRPPAHITGQLSRSKSQPNFNDQCSQTNEPSNDFVFNLPRDTPPHLPPTTPLKDNGGPRNFQYPNTRSHSRNQDARFRHDQQNIPPFSKLIGGAKLNDPEEEDLKQPERYHSSPSHNGFVSDGEGVRPGGRPSTANAMGRTSPPKTSAGNPDALPPHPIPIRPGLLQDSTSHQPVKPLPVRHYNSSPSQLQNFHTTNRPVAPPPLSIKRDSVPVTVEELERLRQAVKANPSDQKAQLTLAKKMVDAASALSHDGGRADQKTKGKAREKYLSDAHRIVKKLVNSNSTEATFYLADCYSRGLLGLEIDTKEAFSLYLTAAKAGHAQSAYRVAVCCEMGQDEGGGTRRDPQKAMQWYRRAAILGDTPAMYKIGIIQLKGLLGQPKDPKEALVWLKRAADRADEENPHALHELALLHEGTGANQPVARDEAYSRQLFTKAANLGYKFSQFRLGCAYEYGLMGCQIDPRQSIAWYSKAAVQEEHQSELALSGWYLTGSEGVLQQSDTEAYLWARKAAQAGLAKAEYAMGYFTEVGIGAPVNIEDAKRWYWRSSSQNFPKAKERLEDLRKGGAKMQKSRVSRSAIRKQSEGECSIM